MTIRPTHSGEMNKRKLYIAASIKVTNKNKYRNKLRFVNFYTPIYRIDDNVMASYELTTQSKFCRSLIY